jgi:hypothetical protein
VQGQKVAVIGSGPAEVATAAQLNKVRGSNHAGARQLSNDNFTICYFIHYKVNYWTYEFC